MKACPFLLTPCFLLAAVPQTAPARIDLSLAAAPKFDPARWNNDTVRMKNNCYAYAADDIDIKEFGAYPGQRTLGLSFKSMPKTYANLLAELIRGAKADGMIHTGTTATQKTGYYRVALMAQPDYEHSGRPRWHWLRQDRDGQWSGKDGSGEATNRDYADKPYKDPSAADFGRDRVVAYFLVPQGGLDVGAPDEPKTHPASQPGYRLK